MRFVILLGLSLAVIGSVACSNSDGDPISTPAPSGPADLSPRGGGIEAMRRYLRDEGIDGRKGGISEPLDCAELLEAGSDQEFCIIDGASTYATGLVILYVARVDSREKDVWEVHLEPGENAWQVTDVEEVPQP